MRPDRWSRLAAAGPSVDLAFARQCHAFTRAPPVQWGRRESAHDSRGASKRRPRVGSSGGLEGDVVARRAGAHGLRVLEIGCVGRHVGARRDPVALNGTGTVPAAQELHRLGDDLDALAFVAVLRLPLAPVQTAVDRDGAALREVGRAVLALRPPDGHVEVVRLVDPLAALVLAAAVDGHAELADGGPALKAPELRVLGQVARDDHPIDVRRCHWNQHLPRFVVWFPSLRTGTARSLPPLGQEGATSGFRERAVSARRRALGPTQGLAAPRAPPLRPREPARRPPWRLRLERAPRWAPRRLPRPEPRARLEPRGLPRPEPRARWGPRRLPRPEPRRGAERGWARPRCPSRAVEQSWAS